MVREDTNHGIGAFITPKSVGSNPSDATFSKQFLDAPVVGGDTINNTVGTKELLDFIKKYQRQKIGLMLDNSLILVATIPSSVDYGVMTLAGKYSEDEIDSLKIEIDRATRETKMRRGTTERKTK